MKAFNKLSILAIATLSFISPNALSEEVLANQSSSYSNSVLSAKLHRLLGPKASFEITSFNDYFERVTIDNQILLASKDGQHLFWGKVIDTSTSEDLIEQANQQHRQTLFKSIPREKLLTYSAKEERHQITIFTDIDCPFCRKLHTQIKDLNQLGISVDYVMLPRGNAGSKAFNKTVNALCATNPQAAMDSAMHRGYFETNNQATSECINNLNIQKALAQKFGFSATPTILFANGETVPGFISTEDISKIIQKIEPT
ncbi:DsbC family protein [Pseudoalteromonas phenolica]|uniref:Thiol:disulfide interchange protein n=1 Tax=Pseudoalteromonas phenolica TaxID=161398 RepID=A0A0S2K3U4_9GAMM|nr:DsbC family protein [Pseudoalteromonas phenolica]ALO42735.1 Thiol:disulfide interchange protein DsbC [Pseudoalteromonas phenolica]MBE0356156.1 hypothetical protein [Pseudoalteromonas phenolica O-BC30]RXF05696.1 DsbC family protein [Pseudoalteromonas phenolica O-BC30]